MRVLILGGTKFIGPPLVRHLAANRHAIAIFHRGLDEPALPESVRHFHGDLASLDQYLPDLLRFEPEIVIDMIPFRQEDGGRVLKFKGVANRGLILSSADVYLGYGRLWNTEPGDPVPTPFTEDSPLRTKLSQNGHWYNKTGVERVATGDSEFPVTVIRVPATHGPGDPLHRCYGYARRMADQRRFILLEDQMADWRWVRGYVEDVARGIMLAAVNSMAVGRIYNLCEMPCLSESDWVRALAQAVGWDGEIIVRPSDLLPEHVRSVRGAMDTRQHFDVDSTRARRELAYEEQLSVSQRLRNTVEWELSHPPEDAAKVPAEYAEEDACLGTGHCFRMQE